MGQQAVELVLDAPQWWWVHTCVCVCSWVCITNARVFLLLLPISFFYSQPPSPKGASLVITLNLKFELKDGCKGKKQDILEAKEAAPNMSL